MKKILSVIFFCLILLFLPRVSHCSEIHEAAKKGEVKVSGNQYSLKNPLTVKIKK